MPHHLPSASADPTDPESKLSWALRKALAQRKPVYICTSPPPERRTRYQIGCTDSDQPYRKLCLSPGGVEIEFPGEVEPRRGEISITRGRWPLCSDAAQLVGARSSSRNGAQTGSSHSIPQYRMSHRGARWRILCLSVAASLCTCQQLGLHILHRD